MACGAVIGGSSFLGAVLPASFLAAAGAASFFWALAESLRPAAASPQASSTAASKDPNRRFGRAIVNALTPPAGTAD